MLHQPKRQRQDTPIPPKQADYSTSPSPEPTEPTTLSTENPTEQPTAHIIHRPVLVPNNPKVSEATQLHRQASIVGKGVQLEVYTEAVNRLINQGIAQDVPSATKCLYDIVNSSGYIRHDENHKTFSRRQGVQAHRLFGLEAPVVFIPPCDNALCTAASHPRGDPINFNFSPETPTGEIYYKVISSHLHYLPSPDATHQRQTIRRARVAVEGCMVGYTHLIPTKGILRYLYQQKQKQHWRLHVEPLNTSLPFFCITNAPPAMVPLPPCPIPNGPITRRKLPCVTTMIHGTRCGEIIDCEDDSYQHTILVPHSEIASTITHERHGSMIDSGANRSMVKEFIKLINPQHTHHEIEVASGKSIPTDWSGHHGDIPETIHFPDLKYDIYSVKSLTALGYGILFEAKRCVCPQRCQRHA